jgi:hypothetical protein
MLSIKDNNEVGGVIDKIKEVTSMRTLNKINLQNGYSIVFAIFPDTPKIEYTPEDIINYFDKYKSMKYELVSTFTYLSSI